MLDRNGNSSEGVQGLDINESIVLSHEDRNDGEQDDNSNGHFHHERTYLEHHVDTVGDYYANN